MILTQTFGRSLGATATVRNPIDGVLALFRLWAKRARERSELAQLSSYELRDFGASRSAAIAEARKPFWRP